MKNLILEIRNRLNASQEDLARMIGISYATVNRWEISYKKLNLIEKRKGWIVDFKQS